MKNLDKNIDQKEKSKFNALASDWWDPNGKLSTLHDINPARLTYVKDQIELTNKKILDVGCGGGLFAEALASSGGVVTGIDVSEEPLDIAEIHAKQSGLEIAYINTTVEKFSSSHQNTFDVITCMELLEHVPDPISVINACMELIKPGGLLFLSTINRNLKAYIQTKIAAEYILKLLPPGTHDYAKYIRPSELVSWCEKSGFKVTDISGFLYIPFFRHCYIKEKPDVNYILCARADNKS